MKSLLLRDKKNLGRLTVSVLRWHAQHLSGGTPSPLSCGIYLTSHCNLQCGFCNIRRKPGRAILSLKKGRQLLSDLSDLGCFYVSFTGGEPLLVEHIFDLLRHARDARIPYRHLVSNGFLLDGKCAARLGAVGLNEVSISIDGDQAAHDRVRGVEGSYTKAIAAIGHLKSRAPGVKVVINTVLFPDDPEQCLSVVSLAQRLGVLVKVQPLNQHPTFDPQDHARIDCQDIDPQRLRLALDQLKRNKQVVNSRQFLDNIYHFFCDKEKLVFKNSPCLFGYHHLEITEDGLTYPCLEGMDWQNGFGDQGNLKALLRSPEYRQKVAQLRSCSGCRKNYYICYYEPRLAFPAGNALKSLFIR